MEKDLIEYIAKSLVDKPEAVEVNLVDAEDARVLELHVDTDDVGKVIGKHGRIVKAMRTVLQAVASRDEGPRFALEVVD